MKPTPEETLRRLDEIGAEILPQKNVTQAPVMRENRDGRRLNVEAYCSHFGIEVVGTKDVPGGGTMYCLKHCVFDENHGPNESSIIQGTNRKLSYQCFHASCKAHKWKEARYQISGEENLDKWMVGGKDAEINEKQADALIRIGTTAQLFKATDSKMWARFQTGGHFECWQIRSRSYRHWIVSQFYQQTGTAPSITAVQSAIEVLEAKAQFNATTSTREVFTRVAGQDGAIYLDLADDAWRAVKISAEGWSVVEAPPVCFRRTSGMLPLPEPVHGGSLRLLDNLVNLGSEENRKLILSWLVCCLNPSGPYPILCFISEQGSGKSVMAKILRMAVDPSRAPIRALPKSLEDLAVAGLHSWALCFDNLSDISDSFSDALCRMATGSGYATRSLYTNDEEALFWATRPIMLNGISEFAARPDLLERSLIVHLPTIPPEKRRTEGAIMAAFDKERPALLGALLDATALVLKNLPCVSLSECPRMADFAQWTAAAAPAIDANPIEIVGLLQDTQDEALLSGLDAPLPQAVLDLLEAQAGKYEGYLPALLNKLSEHVPENVIRQKSWPQNSKGLQNALARIAPVLRVAGVKYQELNRTNKGRRVLLERDGTALSRDDRRSKWRNVAEQ
jgi:hypothetical protein